ATSLISLMEKELQDLYLPDARFSVDMKVEESLGMDGIDHIEFMLSSNKGEPLKPLSKTASGGELSRIMLAINKIFAAHDEISTKCIRFRNQLKCSALLIYHKLRLCVIIILLFKKQKETIEQ